VSVSGFHETELLVLEHRLVERHRNVVLGLEPHGGRDFFWILEWGQIDGAHHDPGIGNSDSDALGKLVLGEQVAQRRGQSLNIEDFAVTHDSAWKGHMGRALRRESGLAALDRGDVTRLDV